MIDVMWGLSFIITNLTVWVLRGEITRRMIMITVPVIIWGLRLGYHIWSRHKGEDYRYFWMRKIMLKYGDLAYYVGSYISIYFM